MPPHQLNRFIAAIDQLTFATSRRRSAQAFVAFLFDIQTEMTRLHWHV
jgi:hypothetical protein